MQFKSHVTVYPERHLRREWCDTT